ncbi:MAG: hypothetical protein ABSG60_00760 [Terracidiphilus sp.]|jgi:hypothetical protein
MGKTSEGKEYAHNKGESDYSKSGGQVNSNPLTEIFHPTYNPPSNYEKEYKEGWDNAKKQD